MSNTNNVYNNNNNYWAKIYNFIRTKNNITSKDITLFELGSRLPCKVLYQRKWFDIKTKDEMWKYFELSRKPVLDELNTNEYDCFIEYGAGWGRNIFHFFDNNVNKSIDYYLLEYTKNGLKSAKKVKEYYPDYKLNIMEFDYNNSSKTISTIKKYKNILMTSFWSIEQITQISEDFFNNILELSDNITFIHIEPVGWQIDQTSLTQNFKTTPRHYYNKNLYKILKKLENENKIKIKNIEIDYFNFITGLSCGTLIKWKKE